MSAMSDYFEDALRTLVFRTGAGFAKTATLRVALATAAGFLTYGLSHGNINISVLLNSLCAQTINVNRTCPSI